MRFDAAARRRVRDAAPCRSRWWAVRRGTPPGRACAIRAAARGHARAVPRGRVRRPSAGTTTATMIWPHSGSSAPTTTQSRTCGMLDEHVLDLGGRDVLAAADDRVVGAAADEQVAVLVERRRRPWWGTSRRRRAPNRSRCSGPTPARRARTAHRSRPAPRTVPSSARICTSMPGTG